MEQNYINTQQPLDKTGYVAFDAISLRNLIVDRLNEQGVFTDQNYIGSNLAGIIDIISYAFNTLMFYLNKTSNESIFTEAQLYENITRIVKLLDYKPIGYQTSTLSFEVSANVKQASDVSYNPDSDFLVGQFYTIPRYSYILIGGLPFSFVEDITFSPRSVGIDKLTDLSNRKLLFQGSFRENPLYVSQGEENEIVTIVSSNFYIDHFNIDVYVFEQKQQAWIQYKNVPSLYTERAFSRSFEKRLNAEKLYDITFGDGINGRKLEEGDVVAIYFLESSGENGVIGPNVLSSATGFVFSTKNFDQIINSLNFDGANYIVPAQFNNFKFNNVAGSTVPKDIETSDSIRKNAPLNFKSQYRLVTKSDYSNFIKTNFDNFINDVVVFSNWDYTGKYLKYFNDMQVSPMKFRQITLNQVLYSDSCNFNNIYICAVPRVSPGSSLKYLLPAQKEAILSNMSSVKTMTSEVVFLDPIYKAISFGVRSTREINVSSRATTFLNVFKHVNSKRNSFSIANDVKKAFEQFFSPVDAKIGRKLGYSSLISSILSIDGVDKIQTKRTDTGEVYDGLSLYMWNPVFSDIDKQIVTNDLAMREFEFFYFDQLQTIASKIIIVEDAMYN